MLQRIRYLEQIRPFYDSECVKIITGVRHAGKSVLMGQIRDELAGKGKKTLYLDFADPAIASEYRDAQSVFGYIGSRWKRRGKQPVCYVFLDGVQNLADWSIVCRILLLSKVSLFVAGSGAPLLTTEAMRNLSGKYVEFRVRPFVYKELCAYAAEMGKEVPVKDYLLYGGLSRRLDSVDRTEIIRYLGGLNAEALRDAVVGCNIRRETIFRRVADFVLTAGQSLTANAIHDWLKEEELSCSVNTVMKYLVNLEEACIVRRLTCYSARARRKLEFPVKFYAEDVAFRTVRQPQNVDLARNLENVVYNELVFMGYTLSSYVYQGESIDFLAEKDGREYLVQVAESVAKKREREKEFRLLNKLDNSRKKLIITSDEEDYSTSAVEHIRLKDFLMMKDLRG